MPALAIAGAAAAGGILAGTGAGVAHKAGVGKWPKKYGEALKADLADMRGGTLVKDVDKQAIEAQIAQGQQQISQQTADQQRAVLEQSLAGSGGGGLSAVTGRSAELIRQLGEDAGEQAAQLGSKFVQVVQGLGESRAANVMARFERHVDRKMEWGAQLASMVVSGMLGGAKIAAGAPSSTPDVDPTVQETQTDILAPQTPTE